MKKLILTLSFLIISSISYANDCIVLKGLSLAVRISRDTLYNQEAYNNLVKKNGKIIADEQVYQVVGDYIIYTNDTLRTDLPDLANLLDGSNSNNRKIQGAIDMFLKLPKTGDAATFSINSFELLNNLSIKISKQSSDLGCK